MFLVAPAHAFLAIASAYYLGRDAPTYYIRTRYQKVALYIRTIVIFFLAACPALAASLLMCLDTAVLSDLGWSGNMEAVIQTFSWCLHFAYTVMLYEKMCSSPRGHRPMLFIWVYVAAVDIIQARSILVQAAINADEDIEDLETSLRFGFAIGRLACLTAYLLTLLPSGDPLDDGGSRYVELPVNNDERESLLGRYSILETGEGSGIDNEDQYSIHYFDGRSGSSSQQGSNTIGSNQRQGTTRRTIYGGFPVLAPTDPTYLGIAKENTPLL